MSGLGPFWRRSRPAIHVGVARLRGRPNRAVLVAVGVATAAGMLVGVLGGNLIAQSREVHRSIQQLPSQDRRFDVDVVGLPVQQNVERLDRGGGGRAPLAGARQAAARRVLP